MTGCQTPGLTVRARCVTLQAGQRLRAKAGILNILMDQRETHSR